MYEKEIQQIYDAGNTGDWNLFISGLQAIACEMTEIRPLLLLMPHIQTFMDSFSKIYPQYTLKFDARTSSDYQRDASAYLISLVAILDNHHGEAGVNNFRKGILYLRSLSQFDDCDVLFKETFEYSVTNLIIGILDQIWGRANPDLYHQWLHGTSNRDLIIFAIHKSKDPKHKQTQKALFHQIADDIRALLQLH